MNVLEHVSLKEKTTLHVGGTARYFIATEDVEGAVRFAKGKDLSVWVLGGGSNIVLPDSEINVVAIQVLEKGNKILEETHDSVIIEVGAGESLDTFIQHTVQKGYWGLENLSLIPGTVAGLAVQNVGAYGIEASSYIESVCVFNIKKEKFETIKNNKCCFGYRTSIFNTSKKGSYIIYSITLKLSKIPKPMLEYRSIKNFKENPTQQEIRNKIIEIRRGKDLDPEKIWSVGSFFKNVEVSSLENHTLSDTVKNSVFAIEGGYKIPSAALIDDLSMKGLCVGDACISDRQANMIINKGNATAIDIQKLFKKVQRKILLETGIELCNEPEFL